MVEPVTSAPGSVETDLVGETLVSAEAGGKVIRGGALRAAGYAAGIVFGLVSAPFLIRHLGVDDYGRYITIMSLIAIVQGFTDAGLTNTGVREYTTTSPAERRRLMQNLVGVRIILAAAGIGLAVVFAAVAGYGWTLVAGTALAGIAVFVTSIQSTLLVPLLAELRLGLVSAIELVRQAATALLVIAGVIAGAGLLTFFAVPIVPALIVLGATAAAVASRIPLRPALERSTWLPLLHATLPVAVAGIAVTVYYRVAIIVMSLIASAAQTGYFSIGFRIVEALIVVPSLLISAAFPVLSHAAEANEERLRYVVQRMFEISVIGGAWLALSTVAGARLAVDVIAGSEFHPSIPVLKLQGIALGATFLVFGGGYALLALRRNRALIIANVFAVCVVLVSTLVLGELYDAKGAAVAMIIGEVSLAVGYGIALVRGGRIQLSLRIVPRVAIAVAVAAAVGLLAPLPNYTLVPVTSILFFASLGLVRAFPSELRDALRRKRLA